MNGYTFHIIDPSPARTVTPAVEDLVWEIRREGRLRRKTRFTPALTFYGSDFAYLDDLRQADPCAVVTMDIRRFGTTVDVFELRLATGKWGRYSCTLQPNASDAYAALEGIWETQYNILDLPNPQIVGSAPPIGVLSDAIICTAEQVGNTPPPPPADCLPDNLGWTITRLEVYAYEIENSEFNRYELFVHYQREELTSATSPGPGWDNAGGNLWVRPLLIIDSDDSQIPPFDPELIYDETQIIDYLIYGFESQNFARIDNGRRLNDLLEEFAAQAGLTVRSEILTLNSTETPALPAYADRAEYANILIYQKSDVLKANATQNATKGELTLQELLELFESWKWEWWIDLDSSTLRIEHVSYATLLQGDDLNTERNLGLDEWDYDDLSDVSELYYEWMEKSPGNVFDGFPVLYDCGGGKVEKISAGRFITHVTDMLANPEDYDTDGFVLIATLPTTETGLTAEYILGASFTTNQLAINFPLSWQALADRFYRHDALAATGSLNGDPVTFLSQRPRRKPNLLSQARWDFFGLDPDKLVNTPLGWAEIEGATYSARAQVVTFETILE